jgi:predicted  nucleic acid-binding Zn-ribbon protein
MSDEEKLAKVVDLLVEMNENMKQLVLEMEDLKNLFMKYDLELEDYEESIREG